MIKVVLVVEDIVHAAGGANRWGALSRASLLPDKVHIVEAVASLACATRRLRLFDYDRGLRVVNGPVEHRVVCVFGPRGRVRLVKHSVLLAHFGQIRLVLHVFG